MRGGHRSSGGRGGDGRSVHERLGPVPTWSAPASSPAPVSREGQGSFDRSRLGRPTRHPREDQQQLRVDERQALSGSRSTSGRPVVRRRSRSVEELESSRVRGRSPAPRSRSPRLVVQRRASQSMSPVGQPRPLRRILSPRRANNPRGQELHSRRRSSSLRHGLPRRSHSPEFHRRQASPRRYQRLGSPRHGSPYRSPARRLSPMHHHSPERFRTSPLRNRSPFPPQRFSPRRLTPPPHQLAPRPISPRRAFHQRLSPRRHSPRRSSPGHSPRRHSPRRPSPRGISPRHSPRRPSPGRNIQGRYSPRRHSPRRLSLGRNSPGRQSPRRHSPRTIPSRRFSPRRGSPQRHPPRRSPHRNSAARKSITPQRHEGPGFSHQRFAAPSSHPGRQGFMPASNNRGKQNSGAHASHNDGERGGRRAYSPARAEPRQRNQVGEEKRPQQDERQRGSNRSEGQGVASPREVTVSDRSISVTKRFSQPEGRPEKRFKQAATEEGGGRPSTSHPSTSKGTGRPPRRSPGKSGPSDQKAVGRHGSDDQRGSRPGPDNPRALDLARPVPADKRSSMRPGSDDHSHRSNERSGEVWRQELPPPPRISQLASSEGQSLGQSQSSGPEVSQAAMSGPSLGVRQGKTLLHHFCEQAALSGQSLAKGEQLLLTWQRAGHTEDSLRRLLHQEQPETQSALQLLLVKALSCLSGIELSALNVNVSELLDQTVAYFMGSGSSRFNSQVPLFTAPNLEPQSVFPSFISQPGGFAAPLKPQESHGFTLAPFGDVGFPSGSALHQFGQNSENKGGFQPMLISQTEQNLNNRQGFPPRTSEQGVGGFGGQGTQRPLGGDDNGVGRQQGSGGGGHGFNFPPARANHDQPIFGQRLQDVQSFSKPSENQGFSRMREGQGFFRHDESQLGQGSSFSRGEGGFPPRSRNEASSSQHGYRARK